MLKRGDVVKLVRLLAETRETEIGLRPVFRAIG